MELWDVLYARRQEAIDEEEKLRSIALEKVSAPLSDENKATLAQLYNNFI